jgi:subtilisin family serine protease
MPRPVLRAVLWASIAVPALRGCDTRPPEVPNTATPPVEDHRVILRNRIFTPEPTLAPFLASRRRHGVLQFFDRPPDSLDRLARLGITVHGFQRHDAYYVTIPAGVSASDLRGIGVRALFGLQPADKLSSSFRRPTPDPDVVRMTVTVSYASDISRAHVSRALERLGATVIQFGSPNLVLAQVPQETIQALARRDWVWWIEPVTSEIGSLLDDARVAIRADVVQASPWGSGMPGLTGSGVSVAMWEFDGAPDAAHPDFSGPGGGSGISNGEPIEDVTPHATQVAGTLIGNGAASESEGGVPRQWAGIAPQAVLFAHDVKSSDVVADEVAASFASNGTVVTNHSHGFLVDGPEDCANVGAYGSYSQAFDDMTYMLAVTSALAAGNEATIVPNVAQCEISVLVGDALAPISPADVAEGYGSINGRATAKNTITVGSRAKDLDVTTESSRGPTRDGRVKPDLVAIGGTFDVPLTMPSVVSAYGQGFGTSFATPQVAGAAALLVQRYRELANDPDLAPDPALLKAVLMNTTRTLGAQGPLYSRGYGVLDIEAAVGAAEDYATVLLLDGQMQVVGIPAAPADACELRVMAVWSDPAMMMPAGTALVHDVDLTVVVPESTVLPWTLNPQQPINGAMRMENHVDNVEQVTIEIFDGGAEAVLVADLPMASEQEVVVHWYYAPCENEDDGDDIGGDGTGGSDDGDGGAGCAGCSTSSPKPRAVPLWTIFMLLALRRRTRAPGTSDTGSGRTSAG